MGTTTHKLKCKAIQNASNASWSSPISSGSQWKGIMAARGQNASLSKPSLQAETKPLHPIGLNIWSPSVTSRGILWWLKSGGGQGAYIFSSVCFHFLRINTHKWISPHLHPYLLFIDFDNSHYDRCEMLSPGCISLVITDVKHLFICPSASVCPL